MEQGYRYADSKEAVDKTECPVVEDRVVRKEEETVRISKKMSALLRHDKKGRLLRRDGWVAEEDLLRLVKCTRPQLLNAIRNNNKARFSVGIGRETGKTYIRANQGHSIPVDELELKQVTDPDTVAMHGTTKSAWVAIQKSGLSRMQRNHIHFASGMPGEVISGMRGTSKVVIVIDVAGAMAAGIRFFESDNGVILSPGDERGIIEPKYFKEVRHL